MDLFLMLNNAYEQVCGGEGTVLIKTVSSVLTIIQIVVPILLIIFGSIDLMKAVMAGKEDEIKKSQGTFVKRAIAAVIVFFIPTIVGLLMNLLPVGEIETSPGVTEKITWQKCKEKAGA